MPGRDGPENLRILKKSQLRSWHWTMETERNWVSAIELSFLPLQRSLSFSGPDRRRWIWDLKQHKMCRVLGGQHCKNCISLLLLLWAEVKKLISRSYLNNRVRLCFAYVLYLHWIDIIMINFTVYSKITSTGGMCYILTFGPAKNAIPRWCTGNKWHILMAVMREKSRGRKLTDEMGHS